MEDKGKETETEKEGLGLWAHAVQRTRRLGLADEDAREARQRDQGGGEEEKDDKVDREGRVGKVVELHNEA